MRRTILFTGLFVFAGTAAKTFRRQAMKQHRTGYFGRTVWFVIAIVITFVCVTFPVAGQVPTCVTPPSGMVSWWPGDGTAEDIVGDNDGTLEGGATFAAGKVGQAFSFDGSGDFVSVPDEDVWTLGNAAFTIDLWANFNGKSVV